MLETVIYGLLILFVLIGVVASVYFLMIRALHPKAQGRFVVVIPGDADQSEIASLVCAARLRMGILGDISRSEVIALDCGMSTEKRRQCEELCRELDHTYLCRPDDLLDRICGPTDEF
ncbi:MAG: hypothetical protein LBJ11_04375 [Oscillospiraceae bacterium]|jgi:hypothetical protein|nr:hypothetical protein [Oscillospiraceae bacterium]